MVIQRITAGPRPSMRTSSGVSATSGMVWVTSATGMKARTIAGLDLRREREKKGHAEAADHADQRHWQRLRQCCDELALGESRRWAGGTGIQRVPAVSWRSSSAARAAVPAAATRAQGQGDGGSDDCRLLPGRPRPVACAQYGAGHGNCLRAARHETGDRREGKMASAAMPVATRPMPQSRSGSARRASRADRLRAPSVHPHRTRRGSTRGLHWGQRSEAG